MRASEPSVHYVRFDGPRRGEIGRLREPDARRTVAAGALGDEEPREEDLEETVAPGRTMSQTFSRREVGRLFGIGEGRLRYWDRSGFISPSGHDGRRRSYTFQDLVAVRSAVMLLENGISLRRARRILSELNDKLPRATHPLGRLRVRGDGSKVVIVEDDHEFEADSGQLLMEFEVSSIEDTIVARLPEKRLAARRRTAYEWYLEGCRLDESDELVAEAEEAYHRAIHLDPSLANAYTNLGNLRYRSGAVEDARILYRKAIEVDPDQPEAHYNLGFLEYEKGHLNGARTCFRRSLDLDPTFADAHFNLAMTAFRLRRSDEARRHWRHYLSLEPTGPWADIARRKLKDGG